MSSSINRVTLLGNLGRDPEFRSMPSGDKVCSISLATSEYWRDKKTGEKKKRTEWHKVTVYGGMVQLAEKYLKKGSRLLVTGCLETREWTDAKGDKRYSTEVVVRKTGDEFVTLDRDGAQDNDEAPPAAPAQAPAPPPPRAVPKSSVIDDDDIPF